MTLVIEAKQYEEDRARLAQDPIVKAMAEEIPLFALERGGALVAKDGGPTFKLMMQANREYARRGGKDGAHIGCIAQAILRICAPPQHS